MFMAIAVQTLKHPRERGSYKVWYLELDSTGNVVSIGVKTRQELVMSVMENFKRLGKSNWRAFLKDSESSVPIELYDFISQNLFENTHFGNLPTINEFQSVLDQLESSLEIHSQAV